MLIPWKESYDQPRQHINKQKHYLANKGPSSQSYSFSSSYVWTSLVAQTVKCLPTMQETWVWSLSWEDPLEKDIATYSNILVWRKQWTVYSRSRLSDFHFFFRPSHPRDWFIMASSGYQATALVYLLLHIGRVGVLGNTCMDPRETNVFFSASNA